MRALLLFISLTQALWVVEYTYSRIVTGVLTLKMCYEPGCNDEYEKATGYKVFQDKASALDWVNDEWTSRVVTVWDKPELRPKNMKFVALYSTVPEQVTYTKVGEREETVHEPKVVTVDVKKWI